MYFAVHSLYVNDDLWFWVCQSREQRKIEAIEKTFQRIEQLQNRQRGARQSTEKLEDPKPENEQVFIIST